MFWAFLHNDEYHFLHVALYASVVVNSEISSQAIVLGFSGKPVELLHIDRVVRYEYQEFSRLAVHDVGMYNSGINFWS